MTIREALDVCEISSKHPLVAVVKAGLVRANRREKEIERAMEEQMLAALPGITARVDLMSLLANIATVRTPQMTARPRKATPMRIVFMSREGGRGKEPSVLEHARDLVS